MSKRVLTLPSEVMAQMAHHHNVISLGERDEIEPELYHYFARLISLRACCSSALRHHCSCTATGRSEKLLFGHKQRFHVRYYYLYLTRVCGTLSRQQITVQAGLQNT